MRFRVGTQGWAYRRWVGPFYPPHRADADLLGLYARAFDAVEVNSTFYGVPPANRFLAWRERTPRDFTFAVKLPGEITHETRLTASPAAVDHFCRRARLLGDKLGPLLVQLPPDFGIDEQPKLERFLSALPDDLRAAIEFRDSGWLVDRIFRRLARAGVTLALSVGPWLSTERALELLPRLPGPSVYVRWMGYDRREAVAGGGRASGREGDREEEMAAWAEALTAEGDRRSVAYGFFNDDYAGHAPASARRMQRLLGMDAVDPEDLAEQRDLFR